MAFHKIHLKLIAGLIIVFFFRIPSFAQQYGFIQYSLEEGLAQSQVRSICQDEKGFLWIGTLGGLSRFNGKKFTNFSVDDGLLSNKVNTIFLDSKNQLWIGTKGGISLFDGKAFQNYMLNAEFSNIPILSIAESKDGTLWVGTGGEGVFAYENGKFRHLKNENGLTEEYIRSIMIDKHDNIWLGTKRGVFKSSDHTNFNCTIPNINVSCIKQSYSEEPTTCISTYNKGVYFIKKDSIKQLTSAQGLISDWIRDCLPDKNNNWWFASKQGVSKYFNKSFFNFNKENGLLASNTVNIYQDAENNIWIGTDGNGVLKFSGENMVNYTVKDGLSSNLIMCVTQDTTGTVWIGSYDNGITKLNSNNKIETYSNNINSTYSLKNNTINVSYVDSKNNVWFGTGNGILKYTNNNGFLEPKGQTEFNIKNTLSILEVSEDSLWFGTVGGVIIWNGTKFLKNNRLNSLNKTKIMDLIKDQYDNIWLATNEGIYKYDSKKLIKPDAGVSTITRSIVKDYRKNLWFGTESGIIHYDYKSFKTIKIESTFNSNNIFFLTTDKNGWLWIGTINGVYKLNLATYYKNKSIEIEHFTKHEGVRSLECNENAAFTDKQGNVWMGTAAGLLKFNSDNFAPADSNIISTPRVFIEDVQLFFEKIDWETLSDSIDASTQLPVNPILKHNKNHLTFKYTGTYLSNPDKLEYRYILEGFDANWSPPTKVNFATYSNLPPGRYTFKVQTSFNKKWNSAIDHFSFTITPPFWATLWFYLLCGSFLTGFIVLIYKRRINDLEKKKEKEQLVLKSKLTKVEQQMLNASMNRHFIFNALNSIQYFINSQDKLSANMYLTSFAKLIRKNLDTTTQNLVKLSEELERLKLYLTLEHMRFSEDFEYQFNIDSTIEPETILIPPMILQPYVENAILHGILPSQRKGEISITVKEKNSNIIIIIADNGIGVSKSLAQKKERKHFSKGIGITEERINLLKSVTDKKIEIDGPIDLQDKNGICIGTTVTITLKS